MKARRILTNLIVIGLLLTIAGMLISATNKNIGLLIMTVGGLMIGIRGAMYLRRFRVNQYKRELQRRHDTYGDLWRYREDEDKKRYDM